MEANHDEARRSNRQAPENPQASSSNPPHHARCLELGIWSLEFMIPPFRGFHAILYKEFLVVLRDPLTLFFMLFPPLVEMIAFGYALDTDVKHMATLVLDEDRTTESRQLLDQFVNTQTFRIVGEVHSVAELAEAIRRGRD